MCIIHAVIEWGRLSKTNAIFTGSALSAARDYYEQKWVGEGGSHGIPTETSTILHRHFIQFFPNCMWQLGPVRCLLESIMVDLNIPNAAAL